MKKEWQLQEAKNRFSKLVEHAIHEGPQTVTRRGEKAVIVISISDYENLIQPETNLVDFFRNSPLLGELDLDEERRNDLARDVEL